MKKYEIAYKKFQKMLKAHIYTVERGLFELAAAHSISSGYSGWNEEVGKVVNKALDEWEQKWSARPEYNTILDQWLA